MVLYTPGWLWNVTNFEINCCNSDYFVRYDDDGQEDGRAHRLRVQRPSCAALLQHAFEAAVVPVGVFVINQSIANLLVPVVGGVPDAEVVPAHRGEAFHSVTPVQAHRFDRRVVASVPGLESWLFTWMKYLLKILIFRLKGTLARDQFLWNGICLEFTIVNFSYRQYYGHNTLRNITNKEIMDNIENKNISIS